jgi:hypothetical protein
MNKSVHQREVCDLGSLTNYRARKISRDSKRKPGIERHLHPVECPRKDESRQVTKPAQRTLTLFRAQTRGKVRTTEESERARATYQLSSVGVGRGGEGWLRAAKKIGERKALTSCRAQTEEVRISDYKLAKGGHSRPAENRGRAE